MIPRKKKSYFEEEIAKKGTKRKKKLEDFKLTQSKFF